MSSKTIEFAELMAFASDAMRDRMGRLDAKDTSIGIFYGKQHGKPSLAFLTHKEPLQIRSTRSIGVEQWQESDETFWTYFMLKSEDAERQFYMLSNDLVRATFGKRTESEALLAVRNCFLRWRLLFQTTKEEMPLELYLGLFGELYVLLNVVMPQLGNTIAVESWSGPESTSKDFSVGTDWREVKTISAGKSAVAISSLMQLESDTTGTLSVVRVEKMSERFDNGLCTVQQLVDKIVNAIERDEIKSLFLEKVAAYGYQASESGDRKLNVLGMYHYEVREDFPRLTTKSVPFKEIVGVSYQLDLGMIHRFRKEA